MPQLIIGIHDGYHDSSVALFEDYRLAAAVQLERLTRIKGDASIFPELCIDEVLSITGATRRDVDAVAISRMFFPIETYHPVSGIQWLRRAYRQRTRGLSELRLVTEIRRQRAIAPERVIDPARALAFAGFPDAKAIHFYDHHEAHALPALFYTDWDQALLVTADHTGDNVSYSYRHLADGKLKTIYGGVDAWHRRLPNGSLGRLYEAVTVTLGFRGTRHEGKVMGLAAMGEPILYEGIARHFRVDGDGRVHSNLRETQEMRALLEKLAQGVRREDVAASVQKVVEDIMLRSLTRLLDRYPARRLGLSGGLFANVKLNQLLAESLPLDEVFIFPPMGDEGLPVGGVLAYLLQRDGLDRWLGRRHRLDNLYLGRDYDIGIDETLRSTSGIRGFHGDPVKAAARRLVDGQIGAIYTGRMEYGPRALGARSILASPARRETHDLLNQRLERSEFMPFAPVVAADKAATIFHLNSVTAYAAGFMTITCRVRDEWQGRIPAVVHVDGTARPQTITRVLNPLYFDILADFERQSGIPVLVNTSFNVHEEPIVNAPKECVAALLDGRIDFVVTASGLYENASIGAQSARSS